MRVVIFKGGVTPVVVVDAGMTGTPSGYKLPIQEKGVPRPQGFAIFGEYPLANRVYLGIPRQLMSKF
ncbi:MAG: hypothetical protein G01um10148_253 [Parcubacteria group bacterium Gr01-1014_8]|nr:MAG: hypothetical protein G01um10148_253 [Parcubacteria group bacterium Gr01-1014_8]